ncbi:Signal transduction response regulator [Sulfurimonas gotlandica GD1]|jgi:DNA-binding response OmpR family regulator|uniref:Signal transduction response regulator n=1 Tax=Sulfurimonas gotlandica (strain DSM 19862 / JCM 16533 / GD1) TaxID=929558 RepID=B6BL93_SULGG|nr:response regulator [Sulfurimonas gotlandica]EDZ62006.1 two component transcriptional regulator, winged helix family, putative [Sulfurimonas gotlandica GD1]EHP28546.1 Signal transduction response regulator [Sulfurimonas gotlandica GD1]
MNIAIVEDEAITALFLKDTFEEFGHNILCMYDNSAEMLEFLNKNRNIDLIFMDIQINGKLDGIDLAYEISIKYPKISIVFITSFKDDETIDRAKIVSPLGYIIKPVVESDLNAILMVVESFKRNRQVVDNNIVEIGPYIYEKESKTVREADEIIYLSKNETIFLAYLIENKNSYISHEQLIMKIWNGESNREVSLRELIYRLRKKMPDLHIKNVPKIGYILAAS